MRTGWGLSTDFYVHHVRPVQRAEVGRLLGLVDEGADRCGGRLTQIQPA